MAFLFEMGWKNKDLLSLINQMQDRKNVRANFIIYVATINFF